MKKFIILLALMLSSVAAMAEEKVDTVIITLQNGTEVRYTSDQFDRVQVIYSLKYGVKVYLKNGKSKDYLASKVVVALYQQGSVEVANRNCNTDSRAMLLEFPHLAADQSMNKLIIKSTSDYGITFSLEWSNADKANRWTCYEMYDNNWDGDAGRNNNFYVDTEIDEEYRTIKDNYTNSGFSKGHLCPSADRQCSEEQNKQTFYLSNIQPQWQEHNGGLWNNLEELVRGWANNCDTLYVVKAATIRSDQIYDLRCHGKVDANLLVPKYFYMAILSYDKSTDKFKAIGLWTVHEKVSDKNKNYGDYAISIDELEERTGIDFFCNLPDDIEDEVEKKCKKVKNGSKWYIEDWDITCTSGNLYEE
ncbi:MAG: DNA/RNA non-specific endonuclease [Prevotella sp.]|nr:DNA/RNA non-specific endonuclease [Prevotella sp.]